MIRSVHQLLIIRAEFADIVRNEKDKPGIDTSFREPDKAGRPPKKEKQQEDVRASQGTYPEQTAATQSNLRVATRLGQLALASLSKPYPATSYTASILKSRNTQVEVGQMHHNDKALNAFCRAGWQVLRETRKVDFQDLPPNIARLNLPRCWAGSTDGVTLQNGDTILPTSVKYTNVEGHIECVNIGAFQWGLSHSGQATAVILVAGLQDALLPDVFVHDTEERWRFWLLGWARIPFSSVIHGLVEVLHALVHQCCFGALLISACFNSETTSCSALEYHLPVLFQLEVGHCVCVCRSLCVPSYLLSS